MDKQDQHRVLELIKSTLGPDLWSALGQDNITEIMVNPDGSIWTERVGERPHRTGIVIDTHQRERIIGIVASAEKTICNSQSPTVAAVLPYFGARFQGFVPPVVPAPTFVIRLKAKAIYTLDDYVVDGILTKSRAREIWSAVQDRRNVLIVGGTGTGKTTLANAILAQISTTGDRVVTIEDTPELQCSARNHMAMFIRDDVGFTWQQAVKASLRVRPDRIVVGEVRDGSALDLLKAWNTGHNGGCATIHANSAERGLTRLEALIEEVANRAPKELIAEAVNLLVHIKRTNSGRVVDQVGKVRGYENGKYAIEWVA